MILAYAKAKPFRYHTPGHKGIMGYGDFFKMDITELLFSDTLHDPKGAILEAEQLAAKFYGSLRTRFLINGASSGVLACALALKQAGVRKAIVARHSHKSIFNGCQLAGVEPVIVDNESFGGIHVPLSARQLEEAMTAHPDAGAVFVTHPNYYGMCRDIVAIRDAVKARGVYLLCDQAHGAHYAASPLLPVSASNLADACIDSAHKTLPALTQAAFLNVNNEKLEAAIDNALNIVNSTSPSYLLMASLDYARAYAQDNAGRYKALKTRVVWLKKQFPGLFVNVDDFSRLVLDVSSLNISGRTAERFFNTVNIYPEFADSRYCVFILTPADTLRTVRAICGGVTALRAANLAAEEAFVGRRVRGERAVSFADAVRAEAETVPFAESEGRIAAGEVGFFPPCLPILVRGEKITREIIDYILPKIENTFGLYGDGIAVLKE
jgi:arginine/lysine/ornithine decarboxylase